MLNLLIGYSLAIASTLTVIAIPIKLFVSKNRSGVSYFTSTLAFYSMVCWAGYTMDLGDIPAYFSSLGPLVCWALSLVAMAFTYETRKVYWLILSLLIITSSLVVVRLNPSLLGVLRWVEVFAGRSRSSGKPLMLMISRESPRQAML